MKTGHVIAYLLACGFAVSLFGCARTLYPVTNGSHAPIDPAAKDKKWRFVVWSDHAGVANAIAAWTQQVGHTVVERARLMEVFNEQKLRLTHTPDDNADVLRVGRLVGADRVIFADVTIRPEAVSQAYVGPYGGGSRSGTVYHLNVSVRAVNVETGEVRWSGTAYYPGPVTNPDQGAVYLAQSAIARALCPVEEGFEWVEPGSWSEGGCRKK
ncbi:MAG: CsgG/HfaB family protein [Nitrospiraceae bacterium]